MAPRGTEVHIRGLAALAAAWVLVSCGGGSNTPPAPPPEAPAPIEPGATAVTGRERLAWTYDAVPGAVTFRAYVDGTPVDLVGHSCEAAADGHACSAPLPSLSLGVHVIAVAAVAAGDLEGERSAPITVQMITRTMAAAGSTTWVGAEDMAASIVFEPVLADVPWPVQLAVLPGGRVLIGQGDGRVRLFDGAAPGGVTEALDAAALFDPPPRGGLSLTAPSLEGGADGRVFLSYISHHDDGSRRLSVVRMREVDGRLGEPAAILDVALAPPPDGEAVDATTGARIAAGPDGLLYVLLPEGATVDGPASAGPSAGVVRLTADGQHVSLEPGTMSARPRMLGWAPGSDVLQMFDGAGRHVPPDAVIAASRTTTAPLFDVATRGDARELRLNPGAVAAWSNAAADLASRRGARGVARLFGAVDARAVLPALPGLVEDAVYADGVAYLVTRRTGSSTSTVVRLRAAPAMLAR